MLHIDSNWIHLKTNILTGIINTHILHNRFWFYKFTCFLRWSFHNHGSKGRVFDTRMGRVSNLQRLYHAIVWKMCLFNSSRYDSTPKMGENAVCEVLYVIFYVKFELSYASFERQRVCHKISYYYEGRNVTHMKSRR